MFCEQCGNKLPENAMFCPKCGTPAPKDDENIEVQNGGMKEHVENVEEPIVEEKKVKIKKQKKSGKVGKIVIASVLGVALVCGGVSLYWYLTPEEPSKTKQVISEKKDVISDEEYSASADALWSLDWSEDEYFGLRFMLPDYGLDDYSYQPIVGRGEITLSEGMGHYYQDMRHQGIEYVVPFTASEQDVITLCVFDAKKEGFLSDDSGKWEYKDINWKTFNWKEDIEKIIADEGTIKFIKETDDFYCFSGDGKGALSIYLCVKNSPIYYRLEFYDLRQLDENFGTDYYNTDEGYYTTEEYKNSFVGSTGSSNEKVYDVFFTEERLEDYVNTCEYTGYTTPYLKNELNEDDEG